jgi:hypothetical protein
MKKRTTTGLAARIAVSGATQCGGAVARTRRPLPVANSRNTSPRMTSKKVKKRKLKGFRRHGV